jgi:tRNA(Ile)-lysidine synthase
MVVLRAVSDALRRLELAGAPLLVAVSGGLDSVALLHALHDLAEESRLNLLIGHVNHGLRGAQAEADAVFVERLAQALGWPVEVARVDPREARQGTSSRDRPTLQEASRALRYRALREIAARHGIATIATAHSADDQAETVLLRLLRGSGPDGLGGIPERSRDGAIVRPLLRVSRAEIERFATERRLSWQEYASNQTLDYARNRLRRRWLPGLAQEFNPQLLRAIGNLAEAQRRDSEWIEARVGEEAAWRLAWEAGWLTIDAKDWAALPEALSRRVARTALERCGAGRLVTRVHLLPGGLRLERRCEGYRLGPASGPGGPC